MVVCSSWKSGFCSLGQFCTNEHINFQECLSPMKEGLNCGMWIFSAFGPFPRKGNIPNFIEDRSFEEDRMLFYESRQSLGQISFITQRKSDVQVATNKTLQLLCLTPQTKDTLIQIYEKPIAPEPKAPFPASDATPKFDGVFTFGLNKNPNTPISQGTSRFGENRPISKACRKIDSQNVCLNRENMFNCTTSQNTIFGKATGKAQVDNSIYKLNTAVNTMNSNVFGKGANMPGPICFSSGATANVKNNNILGFNTANASSQNTKAGNSFNANTIFGGTPYFSQGENVKSTGESKTQKTTNIFGQHQNPFGSQNPIFGIGLKTPEAVNIFGQPQTSIPAGLAQKPNIFEGLKLQQGPQSSEKESIQQKTVTSSTKTMRCNKCNSLLHVSEENTETKGEAKAVQDMQLPAPQKIMEYLDRHVVGQDLAKKVLAVAVYNHYKRIQHNLPQLDQLHISEIGSTEEELSVAGLKKEIANWKLPDLQSEDVKLEKSNIIMLGPTGSGKTLLAKSIANCLNVPFAICDCTTLTQAGYVGEDIESVILKLLQNADYDVKRAQMGIVYLDEVDKICAVSGNKTRRDVGGEGVQQGMLKMLEGSVVSVKGRKGLFGSKVNIDTTNILFVASGAYSGLDKIIARRVNENGSKQNSASESSSQEMDQKKRDECLKEVQACDLTEFGMIPEFIGRFPVIVSLHSLDASMLVRILTEPRNALVPQYKALLSLDNVDLTFSDEAIESVAQLAVEKNTGARGLRSIMEKLLLDPMYLVPGSDIRGVHITADNVRGKSKPVYTRDGSDPTPVTTDTVSDALSADDKSTKDQEN
ncbi:ATP-dependent Clp protease ATP-binding subunit clpX-like, mitochondrial [Drosophila ficusphila]|uniref:ATP-dependent Clp protease ATP-binding subunit clpX-like, mitochondrial n=1 Tax=Drosophila ficusphila TaxID=30025 RepID=UPI0007E6A78A|nr:ATP-dependent Clp protease ATP-binding subunit clpX-like, mitochondrial [Drosophila ficusphila]